jgi:Xaa-Pro aminopeptidase
MLEAREIKNIDEIALLTRAAAMVDGVYHQIYEELKPGVKESTIVANANRFLYENGSDDVEAINAISGERCSPHPHNFTDRMIRPGDQAFFDCCIVAAPPATTAPSMSDGRRRRSTTPTSCAANGWTTRSR